MSVRQRKIESKREYVKRRDRGTKKKKKETKKETRTSCIYMHLYGLHIYAHMPMGLRREKAAEN